MSRQYDQNFLDVPELLGEDIYYDGNVMYARIPAYVDYFVSNEGDVFSFRKERPRLLSTWENQHGHKYVELTNNGIKEKALVHRLMAEAFLPNPEGYPVVRHLNDDPRDNRLENLAWGTHLDNRNDMIRNGHDFKRGVYCFELDRYFNSVTEAANYFGVDKSAITMCCRGYSYTVKGYHLFYEEDVERKMNDPEWLRLRDNTKPVIAYRLDGEKRYFRSRKEASEKLGVSDSGISNVLAGRIKQTGGWRFKEGE